MSRRVKVPGTNERVAVAAPRPDLPRADFHAMAHSARHSVVRRHAAMGAVQGGALAAAAAKHYGASHEHTAAAGALGALAGAGIGALRGHMYAGGVHSSMVHALAKSVHARETGHANMAAYMAHVQAAKHRRRIHGKFA